VSADAIHQVTMALKARLQTALTDSGTPGTVYVGPLDDPEAKKHPLVLFLYRMTPNPSLRNLEHCVPAASPPPPVIVFKRSLPLDLYYLVTIGSLGSTGNPGDGEEPYLKLLGYALSELQTDPELVGFDGVQQKWNLGTESAHVSLESLSIEELSRIWALFPTANYRTSVAYLVTPVWLDPDLPDAVGAPVVQDQLIAGHKAPPVLSGGVPSP
jgi:hypothetical protein